MDYQTLFAAALGLTPPWAVQDIKFSESQNRLDIWVGFPEGNTFTCPPVASLACRCMIQRKRPGDT